MARMPWFKLYTEIRTDPKMQALTDLEYRIWINVMCLAAESKIRGEICIDEGIAYPIEALAKVLFVGTGELESALRKFKQLRMVLIEQDGIITVLNFNERQYKKPSDKPENVAQRVRRHREGKNANVTPLKRQSNATEEEGDIDKDLDCITSLSIPQEKEVSKGECEGEEPAASAETGFKGLDLDADAGKCYGLFEQEFGRPLTHIETQDIFSLEETHGFELVKEALRRAVTQGKRNLRYIRAILESWSQANLRTLAEVVEYEKANGKPGQRRNGNPQNRGSPASTRTDLKDKYKDFYV